MTSNDSRHNSGRKSERRADERRLITDEFGSPKWVDKIKEEYLLWPKQDRRLNNRRQDHRRIKNIGRSTNAVFTKAVQNLLTEEEKAMLIELSQSDAID